MRMRMLMLLGLMVLGLQGQENDVRFTGQGWHDWPQGTRVVFVSGFAEGYANATADVTLKACLKAPKQSSKAVSETLMPIMNSTIECWRGEKAAVPSIMGERGGARNEQKPEVLCEMKPLI